MNLKLNLNIIAGILGILGSLFTGAYYVYIYHGTLATKKEVSLIYVDLRINDVVDSVELYRNITKLTYAEQRRYDRLTYTLSRLEASRDKIVGLEK